MTNFRTDHLSRCPGFTGPPWNPDPCQTCYELENGKSRRPRPGRLAAQPGRSSSDWFNEAESQGA